MKRERIEQQQAGVRAAREARVKREEGALVLAQPTKGICEKCGKDGRLVTHHKDLDRFNDTKKNRVKVCHSCHGKIHAREGKSKQPYLYKRRISRGKSIERFDLRHVDSGGYQEFKRLASQPNVTLQAIGNHFGMTREGARQYMAVFGFRGYIMVPANPSPHKKNKVLRTLYRWIIEHDMLIGEFSRRAGINPSEMSQFLGGKREITYSRLSRIKEFTGLTFEQILSKEDVQDEQLQASQG
jgi:hypothetical protein